MSALKIRFLISLIMMVSSMFGVILIQTKSQLALPYFQALSVFFASLCIFLGFYHRSIKGKQTLSTIFHEIMHWLGLLACIFLTTALVNMGFFGRYEASFMIMILIAFSTFIAGVYVDYIFMIVGSLIALGGLILAFFNEYFYSIFLPAIALILLIWMLCVKFAHRKQN